MRKLTAILVTLLIAVNALHASEEQDVPWTEVRIVSPGIEDTGEITFIATVNESDEWNSVEVGAFGQKYALYEGQRKILKGYPASSISITYEPGYEQFGGHTVHWRFTRLDRSGEKVMEQDFIVSISKGKGLALREYNPTPAKN